VGGGADIYEASTEVWAAKLQGLKRKGKLINVAFTKGEKIRSYKFIMSRSQWPRDLRLRSGAAHLLRSWVRIPPEGRMFVCCECRVLSGRGLCDELITRPEESYQLWCVVVCDLENLKNEDAMTRAVSQRSNKKKSQWAPLTDRTWITLLVS
jgi:hypothetical protein